MLHRAIADSGTVVRGDRLTALPVDASRAVPVVETGVEPVALELSLAVWVAPAAVVAVPVADACPVVAVVDWDEVVLALPLPLAGT